MNILAFMHWDFDIKIVEFFNKITDIKFFEFIFKMISYLGTEYVFIPLVGAVYWVINKKTAKEVGEVAFYSLLFNGVLKGFFNRLRPYQQSPSTITCRDETILTDNREIIHGEYGDYINSSSSSFPSGHAQGSASVYNTFALSLRKRWAWILAEIICILVMISRMSLGVHFLTDVLTGYVIGFICVSFLYWLRSKFKNVKYYHIILLSVFGVATFLTPIWTDKAKDLFVLYGVCFGIVLGMDFEEKKVNFEMTKNIFKCILRIVIGVALVFGVKVVLKYTYSWALTENTFICDIFDMIRYFIVAFVAVGLYPMLIKKLKFLND